jgi:hypothetical protein
MWQVYTRPTSASDFLNLTILNSQEKNLDFFTNVPKSSPVTPLCEAKFLFRPTAFAQVLFGQMVFVRNFIVEKMK